MRILLINTFIGMTSTGNLTYDIYKTNIQNGDRCVIAYGRKDAKNCKDAYRISNLLDYSVHGLWTRITDRNGFASVGVTRKFIDFIEAYKPDVVHLHNLHGYYVNIELLFEYLTKKNIPIVWTFHDCWPFTGHCPYYSNIGCERWKTGCYHCPKQHQHPASYLLDNSKTNYAKKKTLFTAPKRMVITPVSDWLGNEVKQSFFKNCEIEVVYNGVDLSVFRPTRSNFRERYGLIGKKILLGVAINWVQSKGLADLVELGKMVDSQYKIVVVGVTEKQKKDLPKNILAFERTENVQELVNIYSAADVFVNPSREETFGMVTAEALACGTPAVVYNSTASPELISDDTGYVVEVGNIKGLYKAVQSILSKGDCSKNCTSRAHELFDKRINQNKYREIYKRLIEQ